MICAQVFFLPASTCTDDWDGPVQLSMNHYKSDFTTVKKMTTHLQSQKLLTGLNVSLYLTCHRLNDFNTVFIEHIEHVTNAKTWRERKNSPVTHLK